MPDTQEDVEAGDGNALSRPQRRLLRRLFNARTTPVVTEDGAFMTYREAARNLLSLPPERRDAAYAAMKAFAQTEAR